MRRILLALTAAALGLVAAPATADAGPQLTDSASPRICLPRWSATTGPVFRYWVCLPLAAVAPPDRPDPCFCPTAVDLGVQAVLPADLGNTVMSYVQNGLTGLGQAAIAGDAGQASQLHDAALSSFATAAGLLGGARLPRARAGYLDEHNGTFGPKPDPWQQRAADYLSNGITLLQQWIGNHNPQLWDLIVPQLDNAYGTLVGIEGH
jgi:hypothetical protein